MGTEIINAFVVFSSPAGSTRHAAGVIQEKLTELNIDYLEVNLGKHGTASPLPETLRNADHRTLLFIGSPVYVNHAVPPVMSFLAALPHVKGVPAVPFVTWGGAVSGVALHQMGKALVEKGFRLAGAAKILARHSMMWSMENPLGEGHPDASDDRMILELVERVAGEGGRTGGIALSNLAYLPETVFRELGKTDLEGAKAHMPEKMVDPNKCTRCFICANTCPTAALKLNPYPVIDHRCIHCYNCVRKCPEEAFICDLSMIEARIRERARRFNETPPTEIFI